MRYLLLLLLPSLLLPLASVNGCDYCLITQGISPLETSNGFGVRVDERYTRLGKLFAAGERIEANGALETHWTTQLTAFYSAGKRLTLIAVLPVVHRAAVEAEEPHHDEGSRVAGHHRGWLTTRVFHGGEESGSTTGLSDISFLTRYQVFRRHSGLSTFVGALQAGVRLPTGSTNEKDGGGEFLDPHLQPGFGAPTFLAGTSVSYAWTRLSLNSDLVFGVAGTGTVSGIDYEYGTALNYSANTKYRLNSGYSSGWSLFASLGFRGEYHTREKADGIELKDTGGHVLFIAPGIQLYYGRVIFETSFWQPLIHDLNGRQLGESFKALAGVTLLFQ